MSSFSSNSWSVGSHGFSMNTVISDLWVILWHSLAGRFSMSISVIFMTIGLLVFSIACPNIHNLCFISKGVLALSFQIVYNNIHNSDLKCCKCLCFSPVLIWLLFKVFFIDYAVSFPNFFSFIFPPPCSPTLQHSTPS